MVRCILSHYLIGAIMINAYAAGFMDGEGYIGIHKAISSVTKDRYVLHVTISQISITPLLHIHKEWGGGICILRPRNKKPIARWLVASNLAQKFLLDIRPFLILKADEADIALKFLSLAKYDKTSHSFNSGKTLKDELIAIRLHRSDNRLEIMTKELESYNLPMNH